MDWKALINKQISLDDKYLKWIYFLILFMAQAALFMLNASGIPRESGLYWLEFYIDWLIKNRHAHITFLVILLIWTAVFILIRRQMISFICMEIVTFVFGFANKMRYAYTMKYLAIQDISLLNEVKDVRVDYTKGISAFCVVLLTAAVVLAGLTVLFERRFCAAAARRFSWKRIVIPGMIIVVLICSVRMMALKNNYYLSFGLLSERELGAVLVGLESFFNHRGARIDEEEVGIFVDECKNYLLERQIWMPGEREQTKYPTIIVIMSEAFWDMDYLSDTVSMSENPMERYYEIAENCISGEIAVNVYGGQTVMTEFEFLTGINVINLLGTPFWYDRVTQGADTFVSYLKELGYDAVAIHPGPGYFYGRKDAYQNMGFDTFYDMQSFQNREYYRTYLSDHALTDEIIYRYEEHMRNRPENPLFCFAVSIANHVVQLNLGDDEVVKKDSYVERITIETQKNVSREIQKELKEYVNGLNETVDALEELLDYFENCSEEVVVVFFGDHAPSFANSLYSKENMDCIYKTPYLIWTNFETGSAGVEEFNASYLSVVLMDLFHMPPSDRYYVNRYFLEKYPIDTRYIKKDKEGNDILMELDNTRNDEQISEYFKDSLNMKSVAQLQLQFEKNMKFWRIEED